MDKKSNEAFLPAIERHTVNIPNDMQPLTMKDCTVFIGKNRSHRSTSLWCRCLVTVGLSLALGMGAVLFQPTLYRIGKLVYAGGMPNSGCDPSQNRNVPAMDNTVSPVMSTSSSAFTTTQQSSTSKQPDVTVLYSMRNPYSSLSAFAQFTTVYIARAGQATLSFFTQDNTYTIYIDSISVNNSYGQQLLVNGNFDNGTYGWQGVSYVPNCASWYEQDNCYSSDYKVGDVLSQTFSMTPGTVLYIGFKLRWSGSGPDIVTNVTIY